MGLYFRVLALVYGKEILIGMHALLLGGTSLEIFFDSGGTIFLLTDRVGFIAAMNIRYLFHVKIIALLVGKIRGLIEARVILVLLQ